MMQRRAHPFFSGAGCGATLLLALALGALIFVRGGEPFSPGPLAAASSPAELSSTESDFESHAAFETACEQCHAPWRGISAERCEGCHVGVGEQRNREMGLHGRMPGANRCEQCHTEHEGREASLTQISSGSFDHTWTGFSLARHEIDYAGNPLPCAGCHAGGDFSPAAVDCATCHTDAAPQFMDDHLELFGPDCLMCHDGLDSMAAFDHAAVFPLDGAHDDVECGACHANRTFAGTARECVACHQEPAVHAGLFGLDCVRCHNTVAWAPAELTGHTFPLDHGEQGQQACQTCHEGTYTAYTCYNCHEHDPVEVRAGHLDEGIADFADCIACHPTGREDEAEGREGGDD